MMCSFSLPLAGADCWDGRSSWWAEESPGCRSCRALSHQGLDEDLGWRFGDLIWSRWDGEFVASKKLSPHENPNVNGMTTERFSWKKHVLTMTKCALKSFQLLERFFFAGFGRKTWLVYESRIPFESRQTKTDKRRRSLTHADIWHMTLWYTRARAHMKYTFRCKDKTDTQWQ